VESAVPGKAAVALRDGLVVYVRPVRTDDRSKMLAFLRGLSDESRFMRFLSACVDLEKEASLLTEAREPDRFGLIATLGSDGPIIGHACYERIAANRAESAVVVADAVRRRGLGTLLLSRLARVASGRGISVFEGEVLPENHRLLACVRKSFPTTVRSGPGWMRVEFQTRPDELRPAA
jgi:GNAT superfamily N-acetyltransferase